MSSVLLHILKSYCCDVTSVVVYSGWHLLYTAGTWSGGHNELTTCNWELLSMFVHSLGPSLHLCGLSQILFLVKNAVTLDSGKAWTACLERSACRFTSGQDNEIHSYEY